MQIREGANGVFVEGVHETEVWSTEDCLRLLQMGDRNRWAALPPTPYLPDNFPQIPCLGLAADGGPQ